MVGSIERRVPVGETPRPALGLQLGATEWAGWKVSDQEGEVHTATLVPRNVEVGSGLAIASTGRSR